MLLTLLYRIYLELGLFIGLGLSGVIPAIHYSAREGLTAAFTTGALGWLLLMAALYIGKWLYIRKSLLCPLRKCMPNYSS